MRVTADVPEKNAQYPLAERGFAAIILYELWSQNAGGKGHRPSIPYSHEGRALSGRVPEDVVQQIARSADLVSLIGRYCKLKQRGKSLWGLCPFHKEKTPSFKVDPELGLYYCFGCKAAGNVFTFLREVEGLEFQEALQRLARDAGIDLSRYRTEGGPTHGEIERLREVTELATAFYAKCLHKASGAAQAREYLQRRRISEESVARWRLGYAPAGWDHLLELARSRGYDGRVLEAAGFAVPRTDRDGHYDRFRNRLMFPIRNRSGVSIGFGARALSDEDQPKYLNSPEGRLFSKGRCFYGFCEAREAIRSGKMAVIVEGYTDVIMAHQLGVEPVVAVLGTALTEDHARTLRALCERVILVFDADEAGQSSATRSIEVLLGEDLDVRVATLPPGEDPCEFLLDRGAEAFVARLDESEDFLEFRLRRAREAHDTATVTGRSRAFDELAELAITVGNEARRDMLIRSVAEELGLGIQSAMARVERLWSQGRRTGVPVAASSRESGGPSTEQALAFDLVSLLLTSAELQPNACEELDISKLCSCPEKKLIELLLRRCRDVGPAEGGTFINSLDSPELITLAVRAAAQEETRRKNPQARSPENRYRECIDGLHARAERRRIEEELKIVTTTTTAATPETKTTAPTPDKDEILRNFEESRKREDKKSARINPWKRDR